MGGAACFSSGRHLLSRATRLLVDNHSHTHAHTVRFLAPPPLDFLQWDGVKRGGGVGFGGSCDGVEGSRDPWRGRSYNVIYAYAD